VQAAQAGVSAEETYRCVRHALACGYRHIDTAVLYGNEAAVGAAVRDSGIARELVCVTSKLRPTDLPFDAALAALQKSHDALGLEYIDVMLLHQ
jgi:2,5-diketo-D-gluconate reductase A